MSLLADEETEKEERRGHVLKASSDCSCLLADGLARYLRVCSLFPDKQRRLIWKIERVWLRCNNVCESCVGPQRGLKLLTVPKSSVACRYLHEPEVA